MGKNLKYFLTAFLIGLPFWWGTNFLSERLEEFFYWSELSASPQFLAAEAYQLSLQNQIKESGPSRDKLIPNLNIAAQSAISIFINNDGQEVTLFEKERDKRLPIASLTKLMSAKIILENYNPNQIIAISQRAANLPGNGAKKIRAGQTFRAIDLLYPALMESNNTAVYALAESMGKEEFVELMNSEAKNLGMENTRFLNPTGLDENGQHSTAQDLAELTKKLLGDNSFIWKILSLPETRLYSSQGELVHTVTSTNELLGKIPSIIGGKTGETPAAGGCLILVLKAPKGQGFLINIILNSQDRFGEMEKLINWDKNAYNW